MNGINQCGIFRHKFILLFQSHDFFLDTSPNLSLHDATMGGITLLKTITMDVVACYTRRA